MIKINTAGDYVQLIYVDPVQESVQQELKSDTDAFECSYDSDGRLYLQFGTMTFQNPDPTEFSINGSDVTDAADFITKINALFTGGGGGGATIYTADGTLTGNRTIEMDAYRLTFARSASDVLAMIEDGKHVYFYARDNGGDGHVARLEINSVDTSQSDFAFEANYNDGDFQTHVDFIANNAYASFSLLADGGSPTAKIESMATVSDSSITYAALHHNFNLTEFADNAAAVSGGLIAGDLYHTAGAVKIVTP